MWNAFDSVAATSDFQTEPAGPLVGRSLPAISAVVSSLRAMVSVAPAKRTQSPATRKRKRPEESYSQKSKDKPTKKKSEERSKRRQKRARSTRKERKEKNKKEGSKPAENEERMVGTAPRFGEVANTRFPPETQGGELSEATLALMDCSEIFDGDMWEEVDESVLLQDFLDTDSSWPGDDNNLLPSDETGTQELKTSNFLEADSKSIVATAAATVGSSQTGLDGAPPTKRKPAQRFKPHELDVLKAFFHVDPLPSHTAKKRLAEQLTTSVARISTWYDVSLKLEAFVAPRH